MFSAPSCHHRNSKVWCYMALRVAYESTIASHYNVTNSCSWKHVQNRLASLALLTLCPSRPPPEWRRTAPGGRRPSRARVPTLKFGLHWAPSLPEPRGGLHVWRYPDRKAAANTKISAETYLFRAHCPLTLAVTFLPTNVHCPEVPLLKMS